MLSHTDYFRFSLMPELFKSANKGYVARPTATEPADEITFTV